MTHLKSVIVALTKLNVLMIDNVSTNLTNVRSHEDHGAKLTNEVSKINELTAAAPIGEVLSVLPACGNRDCWR